MLIAFGNEHLKNSFLCLPLEKSTLKKVKGWEGQKGGMIFVKVFAGKILVKVFGVKYW